MRIRALLIAAAVLLAGGAGFLAGHGGIPGDGDTAAETSSAAVTEDVTSAGPGFATAAVPVDNDAELPEPGAPLAAIHDTLVRRAAQGEARAACRLAAEHERCEVLRSQLRGTIAKTNRGPEWTERRLLEIDTEESRAQLETLRAHQSEQLAEQTRLVAQCDATAPLSPQARARYWRQAALAGHVPSMRHYAIGNAFRFHDLMDALPALQTYRREAEAVATRAATAGDVASIYALAMAYADLDGAYSRPFLAQTVTPDLAKALAWFSVLERHPGITGLSPEHPVARNVARHRAELAAAATPSEGARAADLAAEASVPRHVEPAIMLSPEGGIHDIAPDACSESEFAAVR